MKKIKSVIYIFALFFIAIACTIQKSKPKNILINNSPKVEEIVPEINIEKSILTIGDKSYNQSEFQFLWNSLNRVDSVDEEKNFQQFILEQKYVQEAIYLKYNEDEIFKQEISSFEDNISRSFLTDSATIYDLMKETYEWLKIELKASHILIPVVEFAAPADTMAAFQQIKQIKKQIDAGESFDELAKKYSTDRKTAINGGNLGYFSALYGIYPITKAAYSLDINQVSNPIRSKSGYHLIKLTDKRPSLGEVKIAHIQTKILPNSSQLDKLAAKTKIDSAYNLLEAGEKFENVAKLMSDDVTSKFKSGILQNFYGIGKLDLQIEDAAFAIKEKGEYSKPVLSSFGWHIIRLIDKKTLESFEKLSEVLMEKATTDSRGEIVKEAQFKKLKQISLFFENNSVFEEAQTRTDTNLIRKKWDFNQQDLILQKTLFTLNNENTNVLEFFNFVKENQSIFKVPNGISVGILLKLYYNKFVEKKLKNFALENISKEDKLFSSIMSEFKNSWLKNELLNNLVYEKSADTTQQRIFYEANTNKYQKLASVKGLVITSNDEISISKFNEIIKNEGAFRLKRGLQPILFKQHDSKLINDHKRNLLGLIALMKKNPGFIVEIGGHNDAYENDTISELRLKNVIQFLIENGLPITKIIENDFGKTKQGNDHLKNQRVTFEFLSNYKTDLEKILSNKDNELKIIEKTFYKGNNEHIDKCFDKLGTQTFKDGNKFIQVIIEKLNPAQTKTLKECRGAVYADYQSQLLKQLNQKVSTIKVEMDRAEIDAIINKQIK